MSALPFAFAYPAVLVALIALPAIWYLLRLTPPQPQREVFPPLRILATVMRREETPAKSPWWLTLLRMILAAAVILAIADPVFNPRTSSIAVSGPLVLFIDNGWASVSDWDQRVATANQLIDDADSEALPVSIAFTAEPSQEAVPGPASAAREKLRAAAPRPLVPDRQRALSALRTAIADTRPGTLAFLSDGLATRQDDPILKDLAGLQPGELRLVEGDAARRFAVTGATNAADAMSVKISRLDATTPLSLPVTALDSKGRPIANAKADFKTGETVTTALITAPFELRNDFARLTTGDGASAGAVHLLDDSFRRRRVVLISGETNDQYQPLLSPLYYIQRALQPYADLMQPGDSDLGIAIPKLLANNPSVIVMADIGRLPESAYEPLRQWIANGGMLVRFAGSRMAASPADDPLLPVILRQGERMLGGTLSWTEPQALADFPKIGPFAGLARPAGVTVKRQVLAEPTPDLAERTWANLADGTPLVTSRRIQSGEIVLFHISAEATWSDLPISGSFVEMLRRLVQMSRSAGASGGDAGPAQAADSLAPYRMLTATGALSGDTGAARPLAVAGQRQAQSSFDNPPGLYGSEEGFTALNVLPEFADLKPLLDAGVAVQSANLIGKESWSAKPSLFLVALLLLIADGLIIMIMNNALPRLRRHGAASTSLLVLLALSALAFVLPAPLQASDQRPGDEIALQRLDNTHLAYVVTGEAEVDRLSERGLDGLTQFLTYRTTLEPGPPVGVDPAKDELSFFPIIYWPISATAPMPSSAAINRIDAYMRNGGTVLFDTRDAFDTLDRGTGTSANSQRLQAILANLDIPPLEPVPSGHVLTKSFYLLTNFPGRYTGSQLWLEARQDRRPQDGQKPTSSADGVSPILITGNDFAGAWAVDENGAPLLPTVPPDETQREYANRAGVNIMMYMLTGNYKNDQVHVPDILQRLGQ